MDARIGHLHCSFRGAGESAAGRHWIAELERVAQGPLLEHCEEELAVHADERVTVVRALALEVSFESGVRVDDENRARQWAAAVSAAFERIVQMGGREEIRFFDCQSEFVASFLRDLLEGRSEQWQYGAFESLRRGSLDLTLQAVREAHLSDWEAILARLSAEHRARLGDESSESDGVRDPPVSRRIPHVAELRPFMEAAWALFEDLTGEASSAADRERSLIAWAERTDLEPAWNDPGRLAAVVADAVRHLVARHSTSIPGGVVRLAAAAEAVGWIDADVLLPLLRSALSGAGPVLQPDSAQASRDGPRETAAREAAPEHPTPEDPARPSEPTGFVASQVSPLADPNRLDPGAEMQTGSPDSPALDSVPSSASTAGAQHTAVPTHPTPNEPTPGGAATPAEISTAPPTVGATPSTSVIDGSQALETPNAGLFLLWRSLAGLRVGRWLEEARVPVPSFGERLPVWLAAIGAGLGTHADAGSYSGFLEPGLRRFAGLHADVGPEEWDEYWAKVDAAARARLQDAMLRHLIALRMVPAERASVRRVSLAPGLDAYFAGSDEVRCWPISEPPPREAALAGLTNRWRRASDGRLFEMDTPATDIAEPAEPIHHDFAALTIPVTAATGVSALLASLSLVVLRTWARWIPGFDTATAGYILEQFVERRGWVASSTDGFQVELAGKYLDLVLEMASYFEPIQLPTGDVQTISFVTGSTR